MLTLMKVVLVLLCFVIVASVLLQPSKGDVAFGSSSQSVLGGSGATSILFKISMWSAFILMGLSLYLSWYQGKENRDSIVTAEALSQSAPAQPSAPATPATEAPKTDAPAAPSGPSQPTK